mmetsp:Transcript_41546/g.117956  ORF Transcript_41546/g.117956 Transcript_41546/m.117956 type:complete len:211 (+) Transcript_41546:1434-2066(+)
MPGSRRQPPTIHRQQQLTQVGQQLLRQCRVYVEGHSGGSGEKDDLVSIQQDIVAVLHDLRHLRSDLGHGVPKPLARLGSHDVQHLMVVVGRQKGQLREGVTHHHIHRLLHPPAHTSNPLLLIGSTAVTHQARRLIRGGRVCSRPLQACEWEVGGDVECGLYGLECVADLDVVGLGCQSAGLAGEDVIELEVGHTQTSEGPQIQHHILWGV